ncbi:MAG: hypothetical protein JOZ90_14825 [Alphaproteobacteria bacterium]|nr:hypothetical protein [Alphaproteobacteria bacterium]MBV9371410.1 hypothetical protein [Alphaproteobacteria bacterium]MBV9902347.1 hypothetical protein [Alphaproteobacteria bacterium]
MKKAFAALAAIAVVAAAAPAAAAVKSEGQSATETGSQAVRSKDDHKICRRFDNSARRTTAVKLCLTASEWKKFEQQRDD